MCDVFCKEFKAWCRSFTRSEAVLSVLEGTLLLILIALLAFLILHLLACKEFTITTTTTPKSNNPSEFSESEDPYPETSTKANGKTTHKQCTWTPSLKTKATTRYFEIDITDDVSTRHAPSQNIYDIAVEDFDGNDPQPIYKSVVLALVKIRPQRDIIFGCTLSIVSEHWTLTAASCIESIEEVDSLDSFVMMEGDGELANGVSHAIADVQIHPLYRGTDESYDLAALKSDTSLVRRRGLPVLLPEMLDYLLLTTGERFTILGYGKFRMETEKVSGRKLREVQVHSVPGAACGRSEGAWAPRHMWSGAADPAAATCAARALCVGPLLQRGGPCRYCAGTPLLAGRRLLGVMAGSARCGLSCDPALYVNIATLRDWLDAVIESH